MKSIQYSLMVVAALMAAGCVTKQTYNAEVQTATKAQQSADNYQKLNQQLTAELGTDQAKITQLQDQLKVTLVNEILFTEGGWELNAKGKATLDKIAPTLAALKGQQIVVEGYTDNVPIGGALKARFPSNLELSSARADDVVRYLVSKGVPQGIISAQGFGESRPVASNDTPAGRAKNRRVDIVISASSRP